MYLLGYDVGGTKMEAALFAVGKPEARAQLSLEIVDRNGRPGKLGLLARRRLPTERQLGYDQIVAKLADLCADVCKEVGIETSELNGIGLGIPGSVDPQEQVMLMGSVFAMLGKPVANDLRTRLGLSLPVRCENDANCFALAEVQCGCGLDFWRSSGKPFAEQIGVGVILGTGVGGGFVIRGQVMAGVHGGAAEIGHSILHANGIPCYCGRTGCAEMYLCGPALEGFFAGRRYSQVDGPVDSRRLFELAACDEPVSVAIVHQYRKDLALFLGNLATLIDPDYFVLGGGLSSQEAIYAGLSEAVAAQSFMRTQVPVFRHRLGDSAGVVGAALLALY